MAAASIPNSLFYYIMDRRFKVTYRRQEFFPVYTLLMRIVSYDSILVDYWVTTQVIVE